LLLWSGAQFRGLLPATNGSVRTLAVLPLKMLQQGPDGDYLGLGLADTIITRIGQLEGITVRPTSAVRKYEVRDADAMQAARELHVDAVLDGTMQRSGDQLRVNISLLRAGDGELLWSETFNAAVADIFTLEDDISSKVVSQLRVRVSADEQRRLTQHNTTSPEAYEYYVKGLATFGSIGAASPTTVGNLEAGARMLERAVKIDPKYARAHAQLASAYAWLGLTSANGHLWIDRARAALARAEELDPNLAESHVTRHLLLWSGYEGYQMLPAFEELRTALRLNPNVGHYDLGAFYAHLGMMEPALKELRRALEIDPTNDSVRAEIANAFWYSALNEQAIIENAKLPRSIPWIYFAYLGAGRLDDGRRLVDAALASNPNDGAGRTGRALALAYQGKHAEAQSWLEPVAPNARLNRRWHHGAYIRACISGLAGDGSATVHWLEETVEGGMPIYPAFARDHCFDPVRRDMRFSAFMAKLKPIWDEYERKMRRL
jgi:TolB-like protein